MNKKRKCHPMDNPNIKWSGSISLESNYKDLSEYFCTEEENIKKVLDEIFTQYKNKRIEGIKINRTNYEKEE